MTTRLALEEVVVMIGAEPIVLRPSLRAATRLAHRHSGFGGIAAGIRDGNVTIIAELIREGAIVGTDIPDLIKEISLRGLGANLVQLAEPLAQFVLALVGYDPDGAPASTGRRVPFAEYHRHLFKIATGALGWAPADAWNATPAEIIAAYEGRTDLLKAIFGSAEDHPETPSTYVEPTLTPDGTDPEFDRAGFEELRAMSKGAL